MAAKIFICYRREDDAGAVHPAVALRPYLEREFGAENVFIDVDEQMPLGAAVEEFLNAKVAEFDVLLAVIGPSWLKILHDRRADKRDFVRIEINAALKQSKVVVPVLVGGAEMPKEELLPEQLVALPGKNAAALRRESFNADCETLVRRLKAAVRSLARPPPPPPPPPPELTPNPGPLPPRIRLEEPRTSLRWARTLAGLLLLGAGAYGANVFFGQRQPHGPETPTQTARADLPPVPGAVFRDRQSDGTPCAACPELVVVPAGSFQMGSESGGLDERPVHRVTIAKPFAVGKFEVTFAEWDACVAAQGCQHRAEDRGWGRDSRPVLNVSWSDAQGYVAWLSRLTGQRYRLLTEAEWEYAARGGSATEVQGRGNANCDGCGSEWDNKQTAPVGRFKPNGFGLYDMLGNVWEWTEDCWNDSYGGAPSDGSAWTTRNCPVRVLRGGSWFNVPWYARSANRNRSSPSVRIFYVGFRVARTL